MKLIIRISILALIPMLFVQAQNVNRVIDRIERNASIILDEARYSEASQSDLQEALSLVRRAKRIILGQADQDNRPGISQYKCISRDNDNRAPYVLSYLDDNFNTVKVSGVRFDAISNCERFNTDTRRFRGFSMTCVSRDNDNRDPWVMGRLANDSFTKIDTVKFNSYDYCLNSLRSENQQRNGKIAFCRDRDADGRSPYVISVIDSRTGEITTGNQKFSTIEECKNLLN